MYPDNTAEPPPIEQSNGTPLHEAALHSPRFNLSESPRPRRVNLGRVWLHTLLLLLTIGGGPVFVLGVLPVWFLAIGPYQTDLALNVGLTEDERRWWRIALFLLPWSMALYWHQHVRR